MSSAAEVDALVQERLASAVTQSEDLQDKANSYAQDAISASNGYFRSAAIDAIADPNIQIANFIPTTDLGKLYTDEYDNYKGKLDLDFQPRLEAFLARFYPNMDLLGDQPEKWIAETIANGGIGIPIDQEDAIFHRVRDREIEASLIAKDQAANDSAVRGFELPPGAQAARMQMADLNAQKNISAANQANGIEIYKMRLDTLKFAIEKAGNVRNQAYELVMKMNNDYINANATASTRALNMVNSLKTLYDATAEYYRAVTTVQGLRVDVSKFNKEMNFKLQTLDFQSFDSSLKAKTQAAVSVAELFSRGAAAYVGAQNTIVQLSSIGNADT
jgi:hypothetical protein